MKSYSMLYKQVGIDHLLVFCRRQLSNVEERLNASREMRKHHPVMATRSFSPLSPIVKRMNSQESDTEKSDNEPYRYRLDIY